MRHWVQEYSYLCVCEREKCLLLSSDEDGNLSSLLLTFDAVTAGMGSPTEAQHGACQARQERSRLIVTERFWTIASLI